MSENGHLWVSITEAVRLTGKSERTVRRWVAGGRLSIRHDAGLLVVGLPGDLLAHDRQAEATPDAADMAAEIAALQAQLQACQALAAEVTGERDYLRQALAAALTLQQKQLTEHTGRTWWQFWKRGEG